MNQVADYFKQSEFEQQRKVLTTKGTDNVQTKGTGVDLFLMN